MGRLQIEAPGDVCLNPNCRAEGGVLRAPEDDEELQAVLAELGNYDLASGYTSAIQASIDYVLDGARTWRFDLRSPDVHPGERASVGAKLEYEVQRVFDWRKVKPLDIELAGIPVDIKATVGKNWTIPTEAHCHLCICTQIRLEENIHRTLLIRTHRSWLHRGDGNNDGKRGIAAEAKRNWSVPLYDWTPIPTNPLTLLTEEQIEEVFEDGAGQEVRLLRLFEHLPGIVIGRSVILTVCAGRKDPMRRARAVKERAAARGQLVLVGTWLADRAQARKYGFEIGPEDWVAIPTS
ncbi:NaeI family type II restriction endonuclease [Streptomyces althioticus]|uniref:NaeI family type II restriction endonuclease n=1 Tax=Streptomyces althioticus TaxID=83380 RepID=UPI0018769829|nr:hypothetical protein GCM10010250_25960 [Streptomyces althioticus]